MDKKKAARELSNKIVDGLELAYERMVEFKRYKKTPLVISKNGVIIEIPPEEIPPTTKYKRISKE